MLRSLQGSSGARRLGAALVAVVAAAACGGDIIAGGPTVDTVFLIVSPRVVTVGERSQATAQPLGTNGLVVTASNAHVVFASSVPAVATVDATSGAITAVSPGRSAILATAGGKTAVDTVQVVAR